VKAMPVTLPKPAERPSPPAGINTIDLSPTIGTEVIGIDLRPSLTPELKDYLSRLWLARKVLFFRDQDITPDQHLAFARHWGELEITRGGEHHPEHPEVFCLRRDANTPSVENIWHSDGTWRATPDKGSILRARLTPRVGGDTLFCDAHAAYEDLPEWLKDAIGSLSAVHSYRVSRSPDEAIERLTKFELSAPPQNHPIVRTHPETGEKVLFVNPSYTSHIDGPSPDDSRFLLGRLYDQIQRPEFQCRFRWRVNSMAFWDNRACLHYAAADYGTEERMVERVTLVGDAPF